MEENIADAEMIAEPMMLGENAAMTMEEAEKIILTPAMSQYIEIKKELKDYLLFYRMGDFYELFFEDAVTTSGALGLTLTSRSKINEKPIPMCGVPFHAYELYLSRLIKMGYKVAICEQTENPEEAKKRGAKAVRREVVRLVTAGTLTEDTLLDAKSNNFIAAVYVRRAEIGLAWLDISTGAFCMQQLKIGKLAGEVLLSNALARLNPAEVVIDDTMLEFPQYYGLFGDYRDKLAVQSKSLFNFESAENTLLKAYKVHSLDAFGDFSKPELIAAGVLLCYVENTQKGRLPLLQMPKHIVDTEMMEIDSSTRRSLELIEPIHNKGVSLIQAIDRTVTGAGGRLLAARLNAPTMNIREINDRLDAVSFFADNPAVRREIRFILRQCMDLERIIQRLSLGKGGPKDIYDLAVTLKIIPHLKSVLQSFASYQKDSVYAQLPQSLASLAERFFDHSALQYDLERTLKEKRDDLPGLARNGGFVREGAYADLDYLHQIREKCDEKCKELREKYAAETGVSAIKIRDNSVIGYFVEVPIRFADKFLNNPQFIHRQSVLNAVRFTTTELSDLENEVNNSAEKALEMEQQIYEEMTNRIVAQASAIKKSADCIAALDVYAGLAEVATDNGYVRPVVDESCNFEIVEGRHPVVESVMKKSGSGCFVGNDCTLSPDNSHIWLLTGPNMAGKSTFLRQNALIAIMAQMGSFVPAKYAHIGVIDKLFSRVGASDDLARGRSTFMVEMVETAAILNQATPKSFVILDEIGRGTATFDGLSIAWSVVEYLADICKCRTIFATHYHELTKLSGRVKTLSLHCMKVKEFNNEVVFMHEVVEGAADRSYGIHVAKLAGLPELAVKRAEEVLSYIEEDKRHKTLSNMDDDLPLFQVFKERTVEVKKNPAVEMLENLDVDALSPKAALDVLYELKQKSKQ